MTNAAGPFVVAIDGPAGAGKSTVAKRLAQALNYAFLDTGAIYRTLALLAREATVDGSDPVGLVKLAANMQISFQLVEGQHSVWCQGTDVTEKIRLPEISQGASKVSALPEVRSALLELQRKVARSQSVVAEGRDMGTVVFPDALAKFFLTANLETRARRRAEDLKIAGKPMAWEAVLLDIQERDERDTKRPVAPLRPADDAVHVDSSDKTPEDLVAFMVDIVRKRGG